MEKYKVLDRKKDVSVQDFKNKGFGKGRVCSVAVGTKWSKSKNNRRGCSMVGPRGQWQIGWVETRWRLSQVIPDER